MADVDAVTFDAEKIERLRAEYNEAEAAGLETFEFEGEGVLLTRYAFYLLEYLDARVA